MALHPTAAQGALLSIGGAALVLLLRQGTLGGALAGAVVALLSTAGFGAAAFGPLAVFVLSAGALTGIGRQRKEALGAAERNRGQRGVSHVVAKLGLPAVFGAVALAGVAPHAAISVAYVAALAGAFADTAATELGPLGPRAAFLLRGFRAEAVPHGSPGAVSLAGLSAAVLASGTLAWSALASGVLERAAFAWLASAAGFAAAFLESLLAAGAWGRRIGHFGRNLFVSVAAAAVALTAWAGGCCKP